MTLQTRRTLKTVDPGLSRGPGHRKLSGESEMIDSAITQLRLIQNVRRSPGLALFPAFRLISALDALSPFTRCQYFC